MSNALKLARTRKAIFPCKLDEAPLVSWREAATSDLKQVTAWWERWPNAMIGLPCGEENDFFVIDLDTDKITRKKLGEASLAALGYSALLDGLKVRTPSGGLHLYFRHWTAGRNSVGLIGPGIDTRAEGGYVIAEGSENCSGRYVGSICWLELPNVPLGLRARSTPLRRPVGRTYEPSADTGEVAELMCHIPPDCDYGTWLTVLTALHHRFGGSDNGLALAEVWSAQGEKFRPGEVPAK